ncbi:hypothetical protein ACHAXN_008461 [Cyclotella atomus]
MSSPSKKGRYHTELFIVVLILLILNVCCIFFLHGQISNQLRPSPSTVISASSTSEVPESRSDDIVLEYFKDAGVKLRGEDLENLPTWQEIESLIGNKPVILGLNSCEVFRNTIPPIRRMLGASGMFNSGTNLLTRLLKENCVIPERYAHYGPKASKEKYGIRWQVPWGKHTPAMFIHDYSAPLAANMTKEDALPVVTVRNPYDWMISMCSHTYTARWSMRERGHANICPHLVYANSTLTELWPVGLTVKLANQTVHFESLAHLWNEWYLQYERDADFPFIMVRFEDLVFRQYVTTKTICTCAGGDTKEKDEFKYIVNSAKQGPGHGAKDEKTDMVTAWIKYGKPKKAKSGYNDLDWEASLKYVSKELMNKLGYQYPPSA